jgi:uncharacterized protein
MCKGQCPGTAIDGDWRNRTRDCDLWKGLFRHFEDELLDADESPLSVRPERRELEAAFLRLWGGGQTTTIAGLIRMGTDQDGVTGENGHGDVPHGDVSHGDA